MLWECWKTEILSLDAQQSGSVGKVWIRCQRWLAHCITKPINSAVLLSKRNFDCSCCVGTEEIPCTNVVCSCCDLKRAVSLHWEVTETPESVWFYLWEGSITLQMQQPKRVQPFGTPFFFFHVTRKNWEETWFYLANKISSNHPTLFPLLTIKIWFIEIKEA